MALANRLKQECGVSGAVLTTTVGQVRELKRLVDWVAQSWVEIQEEHPDWDFLRKSYHFDTEYGTAKTAGDALTVGCVYEIVTRATLDFSAVGELFSGTANTAGAHYYISDAATLGAGDAVTLIGKQIYTVGDGATFDLNISDFGQWRNDSFRSYLKSAGAATEVILAQYYDYTQFRDFYLLGSRRFVTARPLYWTVAPDRSVVLGFTPNDVYHCRGEYYRSPQVLSADVDVPIMPARYHMAIVYKAMQKYGIFEVANEQIIAGRDNYNMILNRMSADQLPQIMGANSLI